MGRLNYRYQKEKAGPASAASAASTLLFEKRVLTCVTISLFIGLGIWLWAVSTDYWVIVISLEGKGIINLCENYVKSILTKLRKILFIFAMVA